MPQLRGPYAEVQGVIPVTDSVRKTISTIEQVGTKVTDLTSFNYVEQSADCSVSATLQSSTTLIGSCR